MGSKPVLTDTSLTKTYGKGESSFNALSDINMSVYAGESLAIVGKSGSGKSTLMHLLALLDRPTRGRITIGKVSSIDLTDRQLDLIRNKTYGFVFQQFFLNGNDSVINNVTLPLKIAGVSKKLRNEKAIKMLKAVQLSEKAEDKAKDLSGGQKQRVVIARALINDPKVIFADEPTGNLDSRTGEVIEKLLFDLNKQQKITLVIVTHDDDLALKCDRQIYLSDGKIIKEGSK